MKLKRLKSIIYRIPKQFIGGNPLQKILNSPREVREVLAVDLIACNNYKNGQKAIREIKCPTFFIFGELDNLQGVSSNIMMGQKINAGTNNCELLLDEEKLIGLLKNDSEDDPIHEVDESNINILIEQTHP